MAEIDSREPRLGKGAEEVPPISHDSDQPVRVRRGELQEWAKEVEHVMRSPIEAPGLWKSAGITLVVAAVFFALSLIPVYAPDDAPGLSPWAIWPAIVLFLGGIIIYAFTAHLERDTKRMNADRAEMLASKIRHADTRTPKDYDHQET